MYVVLVLAKKLFKDGCPPPGYILSGDGTWPLSTNPGVGIYMYKAEIFIFSPCVRIYMYKAEIFIFSPFSSLRSWRSQVSHLFLWRLRNPDYLAQVYISNDRAVPNTGVLPNLGKFIM